VSEPRGCQGPLCAYGSRYRLSPHLALQEQGVMKKPDMACTTIRQPSLHGPDIGARIRQGLSNMFNAPTTPEGVTCSPLSGTTCLPYGQPYLTHLSGAVVNQMVSYSHYGMASSNPKVHGTLMALQDMEQVLSVLLGVSCSHRRRLYSLGVG
jgi:hypothetical protein